MFLLLKGASDVASSSSGSSSHGIRLKHDVGEMEIQEFVNNIYYLEGKFRDEKGSMLMVLTR